MNSNQFIFNKIKSYLSNESECGQIDIFILVSHSEGDHPWWHLNENDKSKGGSISILPILNILNERGVKIPILMNCESLNQIERMEERSMFEYIICTSEIINIREISLYLYNLFNNLINMKLSLFKSHKLSIEESSFNNEGKNRASPVLILNNDNKYTFNKNNNFRNIILN